MVLPFLVLYHSEASFVYNKKLRQKPKTPTPKMIKNHENVATLIGREGIIVYEHTSHSSNINGLK